MIRPPPSKNAVLLEKNVVPVEMVECMGIFITFYLGVALGDLSTLFFVCV